MYQKKCYINIIKKSQLRTGAFLRKKGGFIMAMSERMLLFCEEYLKDKELNATQAYLRAYPNTKSINTAQTNSSKLMAREDIREYIDKRLDEIHDKNTADIKEVMEYLTSVMRGTCTSSVLSLCGDGMQEVISKPPDEKERLKAAELLGKRFGMFTDKVQAEIVVPKFEGEDELED